jgi:hypothetical protein
MTAGQGGPPEGGPPYGQPPGPPYGQPPGPPYGPPWQGYAPAPSSPGPAYSGPTPTERPLTVRAGLGGFVGAIVLSVISTVVTFLNWDVIVAPILARVKLPSGTTPEEVRSLTETGVRIGLVAALVFSAVYGLFVFFAWRGRNWARIVLWVLGGIGLATGLVGLFGPTSPVPFLTGLAYFQLLLLLTGVVLLAQKPSNEWFRYQRWLRDTGQPR